MPTFNQNLNILRNGLQRKRPVQDRDSNPRHLLCRDHYERWTDFNKRQFSKAKQAPWADVEVIKKAAAARRDTPLGILDTIAREYITYWMPEIMLLQASVDEDISDDTAAMTEKYKTLFDDLRHHVFDVVNRVDCGNDEAAQQLRTSLMDKARDQLSKIFKTLKDDFRNEEKHVYDSEQLMMTRAKNLKATSGKSRSTTVPISEARILNSSLAWDAHDTHESPSQIRNSVAKEMAQLFTTTTQEAHQAFHGLSPATISKKRRYSQIGLSPEPDPADNGQVWDSPIPDLKRRKFEFKFTDTVRLSDKNGNGRQPRFEIYGKTPRKRHTVDLTMDGSEDENTKREAYRLKGENAGASEFPMPGAFY